MRKAPRQTVPLKERPRGEQTINNHREARETGLLLSFVLCIHFPLRIRRSRRSMQRKPSVQKMNRQEKLHAEIVSAVTAKPPET